MNLIILDIANSVSVRYHEHMSQEKLFHIIERICNLMRSEERAAGLIYGIQPVQLQALYYLYHCNKYSDTPAAVTEYLGSTKGTVSQTLLLLESKGYLEKIVDENDRRVIHLFLTGAGKEVVKKTLPPSLFTNSTDQMQNKEIVNLTNALDDLLRRMQQVNSLASFGVCKTCQHFLVEKNRFRCGLTQEILKKSDSIKICREHTG